MKRKKLYISLGFCFLFAAACIGGMLHELCTYRSADKLYTTLREVRQQMLPVAEKNEGTPEILWQENMVAWLLCPNTSIDYPVMQAENNDYYLNHLPDGRKNALGALFLDCAAEGDFSSQVSVIYGHNVDNGAMLGTLQQYKNTAHIKENPCFSLLTPAQTYTAEVVAVYLEDGLNGRYPTAFSAEADLVDFWERIRPNAYFLREEMPEFHDSFVILSTCSYEFQEARLTVVGILREVDTS